MSINPNAIQICPPSPKHFFGGQLCLNFQDDEVTILGDNLDKLKAVRFGETELRFRLSKDKKSVTVVGLRAARVTAVPQEQELEFEFEDGKKATVKVNVFSGIYQITEKK